MTTTSPQWLEVRLIAIERLARDINLYRFVPLSGDALPDWSPGAHIDLEIRPGLVRQYSLIGSPSAPDDYRIAVKLDPASKGGSRFLHDGARVGAAFRVSGPRNSFRLEEQANNTVLIGGGIGITPLISMARRLTALGRAYSVIYASRSIEDAAFADELADDHGARLHFDDRGEGPLDLSFLGAVPDGSHLYCCGPSAMIDAFMAKAVTLVPAAQIHVEYFAAQEAAATDGGFTVSLARDGRTFPVPPGKTILDVLLSEGVAVPFSCRAGVCGSCETAVLEGVPDHRDAILSPAERNEGRSMMICCSGARSSRLVLDL